MRRGAIFCRQISAVLLFLLAPYASAQMPAAPEAELKAAILANVLLFVDWPAQTTQIADRLLLCYLGESPVASALAQFNGKLVKGKPLQVEHADAGRAAGCHVLYFSAGDDETLSKVAAGLRAAGVLLAGDTPGFLQRGVMLNLELVAGRVAFDVDLRSIRQAGLSVSSKVLRLARLVVE